MTFTLPELLPKTKASAVLIAVHGTKVIDEWALLAAKRGGGGGDLSCLAMYKVKAKSRKDVVIFLVE